MERYICVHGHFYQPPRENPWLEEIEIQDSAYPFHDWNERISAECYGPMAASRILDNKERIVAIINNYSKMSYNFGPTVLSWMSYHVPEIYESVIESDKLSRNHFSGHGSAIAQVYNHLIMPLANTRDKRTQIIWGIRDFQKRFGRDPEGMWLAEAAVDTETLDIMAEFGIKFTILAPWQAMSVRRMEDGAEWESVEWDRVDGTMPYLYNLPSGRTISLFYYNGPISYAIASANLLSNGDVFIERMMGAFNEGREGPQIVHIANDGESYGHHHKFGDMALAYCLHSIESNNLAKITNYGEFLEKHPPTHEVKIRENSSWSCIHGVERWQADCGCNSGLFPKWNQQWRGPLRAALNSLRDQLAPAYEYAASRYMKDPWAARDDYIDAIFDRSHENVENFLQRHAARELSQEEKVNALKLLEMQRYAIYMFTSCGWFFDEVSGLETVQVLEYAAKAIQYAEDVLKLSFESQFLADLRNVPSNYDENAARTYERLVNPVKISLARVGAHYAISSLFNDYPEHMTVYNFSVDSEVYDKKKAGKLTLATGEARIRSNITWDEETVNFAVLHLGDHNVSGGLGKLESIEAFEAMQADVHEAFARGDTTEIIRSIDKHFEDDSYSLYHLFRDEQRRVLDKIFERTHVGIEASYRQIYEYNNPVMSFLSSLHIPIPEPIFMAAQFIVNLDFNRVFKTEVIDMGKLERLIAEAQRWGVTLDSAGIGRGASQWVISQVEKAVNEPEGASYFETIINVLRLVEPLSLGMDLRRAQNILFDVGRDNGFRSDVADRARNGDEQAVKWLSAYHELANMLKIHVEDEGVEYESAVSDVPSAVY
jgi:alpha-amylase/alpha-mannosidase (GH57 family)